MDRALLEDRVFKAMIKISELNGEKYMAKFYNPRPYPGWSPEMKHYMMGFVNTIKEMEAKGKTVKIDSETIDDLFNIIIRISDTMNSQMRYEAERLGETVSRFNYNMLSRLYEQRKSPDENIFISPGRLQAVLALLSCWAGWFMQEIILNKIFCGGLDIDELNDSFGDERFILPNIDDDNIDNEVPTIELKTILWMRKHQKIDNRGLIDTSKSFLVQFKNIDFKSPDASDIISKEIAKASHGLLDNVHVAIKEDTKAILTDILYFKAAWENCFETVRTEKFYYQGGESKVKMMKLTSQFAYFENEILQSIVLPYRCSLQTRGYSMVVHLPKKGKSIESVIDCVSDKSIQEKYTTEEVKLSMPKFELESQISLKELLNDMGMKDVFSDDDVMPNILHHVNIGDIVQQGKIKVDENGTEAAMATVVYMDGAGCLDVISKPKVMQVNHEFVFEIVETYSGHRLFSGIVSKL